MNSCCARQKMSMGFASENTLKIGNIISGIIPEEHLTTIIYSAPAVILESRARKGSKGTLRDPAQGSLKNGYPLIPCPN